MSPYSRHAKGPAVAESVTLVALGLTLSSGAIHQSLRRSGICRVALDFLTTISVLLLFLADSRSGQMQRARYYTTRNPYYKRFTAFFAGFLCDLQCQQNQRLRSLLPASRRRQPET